MRAVETQPLLTVSEVAEMLSVKPGWIYENKCRGTLPFPSIKVGNFLRFKKSAIDRYIERQSTAPN